ncbi:MAG TPA: hypothetical protein VGG86_04695 [Roseiarcus sp.]
MRSGFTPRCARESDDGGEVRFDKICRIIRECPYSVHDISKTELDADSGLPRFNMPFELGLFLGAKRFGGRSHNHKKTLIFDRDRFRYQSYISDIAGQDIHPHKGNVDALIRELAAWLRDEARDPMVPGGVAVASEFGKFKVDLSAIAAETQLEVSELTFKDLVEITARWILKERGI